MSLMSRKELPVKTVSWHRVKLILERALEQTHAARREYVWLACGSDARLREEVESLLDEADQATEGFLELPATLPMVFEAREPEWIGKRIGAFRIQNKLASGGMGHVFLASRDDGGPCETLVVKVVRGDGTSAMLRRRFDQERRIHAALRHPCIARVADIGVLDDHPFMLLEYVEGERIDKYCARKRLDMRARIELMLEVCTAVEYVQAQRVVHGDIKPANVLVTPRGKAKLLDFGIAEILSADERAAGKTMLQLEGAAMFTPESAAPEQLKNEPLTMATDVYGLGHLLYRLLTGHLPHNGHRSGLTLAWLRAVCEHDAMCPSALIERDGVEPDTGLPTQQQLVRGLKGELDRILLKTLAREPSARYRSATALAADLRHYLCMTALAPRRPITLLPKLERHAGDAAAKRPETAIVPQKLRPRYMACSVTSGSVSLPGSACFP
jgi:serine/threonine-protein kinase